MSVLSMIPVICGVVVLVIVLFETFTTGSFPTEDATLALCLIILGTRSDNER